MSQHLFKASSRFRGSFIAPLSWLCILALSSILLAQPAAPVLVVREAGTILYARQEITSDRIATLEKDERLTPLAQALGPETWYMVRTQQGMVGWVRSSDVSPSSEANNMFKEEHVSNWSATAANGSHFEGTWSVNKDALGDKAEGTWTLHDGTGKPILRGTWSAEKFSTGWSGDWHATAENRQGEYRGSWTTDLPRGQEARLADLFAAAARDAVRGVWSSKDLSGSWLIRAAQ